MAQIKVTFRDFPSSPTIETKIRKRAEKLTQFYDRIVHCYVVVELEQKNRHQGKLFGIKIHLTVPGKQLDVTHKSDQDINVAIREAFKAIEHQLEEYARKRQGNIKTHHDLMHGHIARIVPIEGYGFINGIDGNEYYFSITNVAYPNFSQLCVGDAVEYTAQTQNDGRHAQHIVKEKHNNHEQVYHWE